MTKKKTELPNALIIGGTSGLGLEISILLKDKYEVFITGRKDPKKIGINFIYLDITNNQKKLAKNLSQIVNQISSIDLLVYAAGFYENGLVDQFDDSHILTTNNVGIIAPQMLCQRILHRQNKLPGFIAITSTSQWIPRLKEPLYTASKAGLAMFSNSLSLDPRVGKVLVVGPAGMKTRFWDGNKRENDNLLLDPKWVAELTLSLYKKYSGYILVKILRNPPRFEVVEKRSSH